MSSTAIPTSVSRGRWATRFTTKSQQPAVNRPVVQGWPGVRKPSLGPSRRRNTNRQVAVSPKKMKSTAIM